jgi:superfamily II DNA or RNA helicase
MSVIAHEPVVLRDYQQASVRQICLTAKGGARRITCALPTGAGKTEVFAELCRIGRYPLVIAPLLELMRQSRDRLQLRLGEEVDIEQGANVAEWMEGFRRRVIVGSRDSLLSGDRYKMTAYDRITLVVVDECHIGTTPAFERLLTHFETRGATIVGFSATPFKKKGRALRYWPRPEVAYGMLDFIKEGWLVGPTCHLSESRSFDLTLVDEVSHEWDKRLLADVLTGEHFAQEISSLVLQTFGHRPSVVYCGSLRQLRLLADVFSRYQLPVAVVHSKQNPVDRAANMEAFRRGDVKVILNVGVLSCGWDHPEVRNIYFASPQRSLSRYEQRLGRGTRPLPGVLQPGMTRDERLAAIAASDKPTFHVYDITDASRSHQILNALDVLDHKTRKSRARRERLAAALSEGEVCATSAIAAQDAHDLAELQSKTADIIEKRKKLIVGVTFDHETRDLFSRPDEEKKRRGWRMLYGKYQGVPLTDIPADYLSWVINSTKRESPFKSAVRKELVRRKAK